MNFFQTLILVLKCCIYSQKVMILDDYTCSTHTSWREASASDSGACLEFTNAEGDCISQPEAVFLLQKRLVLFPLGLDLLPVMLIPEATHPHGVCFPVPTDTRPSPAS